MDSQKDQLSTSWTIDGDLESCDLNPSDVIAPERIPPQTNPSHSKNEVVESPPTPEQIVESLLFAGGAPLTPDHFANVIRSTADHLHQIVAKINFRYRVQHRPYSVQSLGGGYILSVKSTYQNLREKLYGGPREARLSQQALDVLSVIAYRQPLNQDEIDTIRGTDSSGVIRQLARLGLIAVSQRGQGERSGVTYCTTNRFLELFQLSSLDDLPRLGDAQQL